MAGGQKMDSKRGTLFRVQPNDTASEVRLVIDKKHPLFNPSALRTPTQRMIDSVALHGILEPIKVAENPDEKGEGGRRVYYVVFGRRRFLSWQIANKLRAEKGLDLLELPCLALHATVDSETAPLEALAQQAAENIHEQDTPLEIAHKLAVLMEAKDNVAYAAMSAGVTVAAAKQLLALLAAPKEIRARVDEGEISLTAGLELAKLDPEALAGALKEIDTPVEAPVSTVPKKDGRKKKKLSVSAAKRAVAKSKGREPRQDSTVADLVAALRDALDSVEGWPDRARAVLDKVTWSS